jgi:TonB family protein
MMFDGEGVRTVVKFYMPEIQECYERVLADTGSKLEGRVVVGFIVDTNGNVTDARVLGKKSTLKDDRVHDCVLRMKYWPFPKPGDNRDHPIEYPFDLKVQQ